MMNVEGFRKKGEFPQLYRDFIRKEGAPSVLRRDNAQEESWKQFTENYILKINFLSLIIPTKIQ